MASTKRYILAVSGGVDSVVLLHRLLSVKPPNVHYIVAHVDHGIRSDSHEDAEFVKKLASNNNCEFEEIKLNLKADASEQEARNARYEFLDEMKEKHKAEAIIVAHHSDDVLETMILNIIRGTGPIGLIGFTRQGIVRPLINWKKDQIFAYAKENKLAWRDDSTNLDTDYLRNYIRHNIMPKIDSQSRKIILEIREKMIETEREIATLCDAFLVQLCEKENCINRCRFVTLPYTVQKEIMAHFLRKFRVEISKNMIDRAVLATKTLLPEKHIELNKTAKLYAHKKTVCVIVEGEAV